VAQLVEALRYKPEDRRFDSRWCHRNFLLTQSFRPHCGPGVDSAFDGNEYQEYFLVGKGGRCVGLTTLPPSCADCLEMRETQPPENLRACPGPVMGLLYFTFTILATFRTLNTRSIRKQSQLRYTIIFQNLDSHAGVWNLCLTRAIFLPEDTPAYRISCTCLRTSYAAPCSACEAVVISVGCTHSLRGARCPFQAGERDSPIFIPFTVKLNK
jgi:hypothetical protein